MWSIQCIIKRSKETWLIIMTYLILLMMKISFKWLIDDQKYLSLVEITLKNWMTLNLKKSIFSASVKLGVLFFPEESWISAIILHISVICIPSLSKRKWTAIETKNDWRLGSKLHILFSSDRTNRTGQSQTQKTIALRFISNVV